MKAKTQNEKPKKRTRTVKISDELHHTVRVISVERRIALQDLVENLINFGLAKKVHEKFKVAA